MRILVPFRNKIPRAMPFFFIGTPKNVLVFDYNKLIEGSMENRKVTCNNNSCPNIYRVDNSLAVEISHLSLPRSNLINDRVSSSHTEPALQV